MDNARPHARTSSLKATDAWGWAAPTLLALSLLAGGWARLHLALTDDGIYWPDEIYQSLEPAHRLVFGYGLVPWEFIRGARSWAFPGMLAGLLALGRGLGLDEPRAYLSLIRTVLALTGTATAWAVYRLARRLGAWPLPAAAGAAAWAGGAVFIYFAPRALTECVSALLVPLGFTLALPEDARPRQQALGALWLGAAVFLRLHNALFCLVLLGTLAARRRFRPLIITAVVFALAGVALGLLDRLTWGHWFQSAREYLAFNLVEGKASQWGTAGPGYYARVLLTAMPGLTLASALLLVGGAWRVRGLGAAVVLFLLAHSLVPHKELRFILPVLPLVCAAAAVGASRLPSPTLRNGAAGALVLAALISGLRAGALTFGELGQYEELKPGASAYDDFGPVNRLLLRAHGLPALCGLKIEGVHLAWTGGYTYLHRRVPLYGASGPPRQSLRYDHVITPRRWAQGTQVLAVDGAFALARLPVPACDPDPAFSWTLP